jgi:regulator of cell morphogenesis and NO signaling
MSPTIDSGSTLGTLAAEQPRRIALFERLRLDYCCGGSTRLADACARRGLDVDSVREQIEAVDRDGLRPDQPMPEWRPRDATVGELCEHVVSVHHERMREEMPRISELLETVVRVHGADHPDLEMVARTFASLRNELEKHIEEEELVLFPVCRGLEQGSVDPAGVEPGLVDRHRTEHEAVGRRLDSLRELAGGYELSQALCSTHRSLLERLQRFEADLHRHVHEENNVLLDRVGAMLDGPPVAGATPVDVLIEALVELADAGRAERASRLAAKA